MFQARVLAAQRDTMLRPPGTSISSFTAPGGGQDAQRVSAHSCWASAAQPGEHAVAPASHPHAGWLPRHPCAPASKGRRGAAPRPLPSGTSSASCGWDPAAGFFWACQAGGKKRQRQGILGRDRFLPAAVGRQQARWAAGGCSRHAGAAGQQACPPSCQAGSAWPPSSCPPCQPPLLQRPRQHCPLRFRRRLAPPPALRRQRCCSLHWAAAAAAP